MDINSLNTMMETAIKVRDPSQTEQWNLCTDGGCSNVGGGAFTELGAATLSDAVDGDVASYTGAGATVDAGNGNVANLQLKINANTIWAMLFTAKML